MLKAISAQAFAILLLILTFESFVTSHHGNGTLSITVTTQKNQTGHTLSQLTLDKLGTNIPDQWTLNLHHKATEHAGVKQFHLRAIAVAPPPRPTDYQLFPGVGYYKFHAALANGFEDASLTCALEGGHLAIVNSEAEHQVMQTLFAKHPENVLKTVWAFVGFHDRHTEGQYVTIFGQPLSTTGFTRWSSQGQPDNYNGAEDCGSVHRNGGLNDIGCSGKLPFICEFDLSWTEN